MNPALKPQSRTVIFLLVVAALMSTAQALTPTKHETIVGRARRLLATPGGYVIVADPDVKVNCDDQGVAATSLSLTLPQRDDERSKFSGKDHPLVDILNSSSGNLDYSALIMKSIAGPLGASGVFFAFSFLSLPFLFFWSITECCCKRTCCMKEPEKDAPPRSKPRIVCWILGAVIAITTVAVVIGWVVTIGKLAGAAKEIKCGITIFYSDIIKGTELSGGTKFAGTTGLNELLQSYIDFIDSVPSIKVDAETVKGFNLNLMGTSTLSKYNTFKSTFSSTGYNYKGAKTPSTSVVPNIATTIKGAIDTKALETEATTLNKTAVEIHGSVAEIASYSPSGLVSTRKNLVSMQSSLSSGLATPVTDLYNSIAGKGTPDYGKSLGSAMQTFMIVSIIVTVLFTAAYLTILYFTAKLNKFHKLKIISKIIMLLQLLLGIFILLFAIFGSIISLVFIIGCAVMDGIISTPDYMSKISSDKTISDVMSNCVYRTASGDLLKALGADLAEVDKISSISTGMQAFDSIAVNLTTQTSPKVGGAFNTDLTNFLAYTDVGRGTPEDEDVKTGYEYFNALQCGQDMIAPLTVPSLYAGSLTTDNKDTSVNAKYLIRFSQLPAGITLYGTRAYGGACTGTGTLSAAAGGAALQKVYDSIVDYKAKYALLQTFYNTNFYNDEGALFTKLKDSVPYLQRINTKISAATATLNNMNGTFKAVADCRVMQKEIILVENVFCFRTGGTFITMNNLAVAVGALIFVYTWCICCGIRLATQREDQPQNAVGPQQNFNKIPDQSLSPDGNQAQSMATNKNTSMVGTNKYV
jgi:hypothetical protein